MKNKEWIVFLGWTPHPVMGKMDLIYLTGLGDNGFGDAHGHQTLTRRLRGRVPERRQAARAT